MGGAREDTTDWKGLQTSIQNAATQQFQNNRLNTSNPFASQTFNGDGSVSSQFSGGLNQAATGLQGQVAGLGQPMDWSRFAPAGTGDSARQQAFDASYGQATSRLDPQWDRRMEAERTRLLNQGFDPTSEGFQSSMGDLNRARNDAYTSATNNAISQSTVAGDSVFRNNMMARQSAISDALRARSLPLQEMQQLQGFLGNQPTYNADSTSLAGQLGATSIAQQASAQQQREDEARRAQEAAIASAAGGTAAAGLGALAAYLAPVGFMF